MDSNYDLIDKAKKFNVPLIFVNPKDKLPKRVENGAYIINLQDDFVNGKDVFGTHWVGLWVENDGVIYFDSFGIIGPSDLEVFLSRRFNDYMYNTKQIQDISYGHCGDFVVLFLSFMNRNKHMSLEKRLRHYQSLFKDNPKENLKILEKYIKL